MAKPEPQKGGWIIVALLFLFMLINFVDKAIVGLAGVPTAGASPAEGYGRGFFICGLVASAAG
jgi:hypothetical protein